MANHEVSLQCGYLISHGRGGSMSLLLQRCVRLLYVTSLSSSGWNCARMKWRPVPRVSAMMPNLWVERRHPGDEDDGEVLGVEDEGMTQDVAVVLLLGAAEDGESGVLEGVDEAEGVATPGQR